VEHLEYGMPSDKKSEGDCVRHVLHELGQERETSRLDVQETCAMNINISLPMAKK